MIRKYLIILFFIAFYSNAQTDLINLKEWNGQRTDNMYVVDSDNDLNQFEGTWLYTSGTTSLKIILVKKQMTSRGNYYEDILIGEYHYIQDGVTIVNTLSDINTVLPYQINHKIAGNFFQTGGTRTPFDDYTDGEIRVTLHFKEFLSGSIVIRKAIVGGNEAIQILKRTSQSSLHFEAPIITPMFPDGYYTLIKLP